MKIIFTEFIFLLSILIYIEGNYINQNYSQNYIMNGIYIIYNLESNLYFSIKNDILDLSSSKDHFRVNFKKPNIYCIESRGKKKKIGVDSLDNIKIYNKVDIININKIYWNIIRIKKMEFLIQNKYNHNLLEAKDNKLKFSNKTSLILNNMNKTNRFIEKKYIFRFLKLFEEGNKKSKYLNKIKMEPVDIIIKYIDLSDKSLKREGIIQIYKDQNNEELKYSIRSILNYISWARKIYIIMPNNEVKFLKSIDEIKEKFIYIKDKDILGFDSANIHSFTFNLYKLEKYNISNNFIYMEDDFFIGRSLDKSDFFYYDERKKQIFPYIITYYFNEINKTKLLNEYYNMSKERYLFHPHSGEGWKFSVLSTKKYFLEKYNFQIINTKFTHNAIPENINDLKEIFEEIKEYKYINETLFSKERHILTLNQPQFLNLYNLNIKHRKVNSIPYNYIPIELINKMNLNTSLFVLNTGGNHKPLKRHYSLQKKIMEKRFPFINVYEILNNKKKQNINYISINLFFILKLFLILNYIKILYLIN